MTKLDARRLAALAAVSASVLGVAGCFEIADRDLPALERLRTSCALSVGRAYVMIEGVETARFRVVAGPSAARCAVEPLWTQDDGAAARLNSMTMHRFARLANGDLVAWRTEDRSVKRLRNPDASGTGVSFARFLGDGSIIFKSHCGASANTLAAEPGRQARLERMGFAVTPSPGSCRFGDPRIATAVLDDAGFATSQRLRPID